MIASQHGPTAVKARINVLKDAYDIQSGGHHPGYSLMIDRKPVETYGDRASATRARDALRDHKLKLARDPRRCLPWISPHVLPMHQPNIEEGCYVLRLCNDGWLTIEPRLLKPEQAPVSVPIAATDDLDKLEELTAMLCRRSYPTEEHPTSRAIYSGDDYTPGEGDFDGIAHVRRTVELFLQGGDWVADMRERAQLRRMAAA